MPEVGRVAHLRYVPRHEIGGAAISAAGEDERVAAERIAGAIGPRDLDAADCAAGVGKERGRGRIDDEVHLSLLCRLAQPIDELQPRAAGQAVHAPRRMTGVVEVLNQGKWQTVAFGQPFDSRAGLPRDEVDDCAVRFAVRLALKVRGEQCRAVADSERQLPAGTGGGDQACR